MKNIVRSTLLLGIFIFAWSKSVMAACEVSVSPSETLIGVDTHFSFTVKNTGETALESLIVPTNYGESYTIVSVGSEMYEVSFNSGSGENANVFGSAAAGSSYTFYMDGYTGPTATDITWVFEASEQRDGSSPILCSTATTRFVNELSPSPTPETPTPTSIPGATATPTAIPTVTPIVTTTTITKTVIVADTMPPTVQINTQFEKPLTKAESIEGVVFDTGAVNAGISKIQYSLDLGKSWLLVDEPNGAAQSNFSFIPEISEDGNYSIKVRALDKSGNIGISTSLIMIIDRLPPRIIHTLWNVGPVVLRPNFSGKIDLAVGVPAHFTAQGVGGITEMELSIGQNVFPLIKNTDTGFWEGAVLLTAGGEWDAMIRALDGPGSFLEQKISTVSVTQSKTVTPSNTLVTVWRKNELTGRFAVWNGEPYMQKNPYKGKTDWFLLPGTYYFYLSAPGYNPSVSTIFTFTESRAIAINTQLKKWNLWDFFGGVNEFQVKTPSLTSTYTDKAVGKKITWLENKQWKGKDIVFSIVPSWDPAAASRLITLLHVSNQEQDVPYIVVIPGANTSTVNLLKERGQYDLNFVADPDGEILKDFPSSSFPLTVKVNRRGIVEEVLY